MPTRSSDFKLEVTTSSSDPTMDANLARYYGHVSITKIPGGCLHMYEGTWQAMKYLAQTLEKKFDLNPQLTYQGRWSKPKFGVWS